VTGSSVLMMIVAYGCIQNVGTSVIVTMFALSVEPSFVKSTAKFDYYILFEYYVHMATWHICKTKKHALCICVHY